jgi:hypothetical protein
MNAPTVQKTCPFCLRHFDAHPAAIYCSLACRQRAKWRRRTQRVKYKAFSPEDSPNEAEYVNISAEDLARVYADIIVHVYERDIKLIGTIPPNVPKPSDVVLQNVPGTNYSIAYHRVRALMQPEE